MNSLNVYNLSNKRVLLINKRGLLINKRVLIYILSFKSITVCNLKVGCVLIYKVNLKAILIRSLNLFKWVGYETNDFIEFKRVKKSTFFNLFY